MLPSSKFSSSKKDAKDSDKEKKGRHSETGSRADTLVNENALPGACWNNDLNLVKTILAKDSCNVNLLNDRSILLHFVSFIHCYCIICYFYLLFVIGSLSFASIPHIADQTGLYCAARQGHTDIMIELVNHKNINPNAICAQGSTALHGTRRGRKRDVLRGCDIPRFFVNFFFLEID
jgi:hypothetical protein